jgi:hypothetical protein
MALSLVDVPAPRYWHSTAWTGSTMIIWGGNSGLTSGGIYSFGGSAPQGFPSLTAGKSGTAIELSWSPVFDASGYDVVKGNLGPLRNTGGNFTTVTKACVVDDLPDATVLDNETPPPSGGLWYLVRAVNACGNGSYDEGGAQQGSRDAEIDASPNACP